MTRPPVNSPENDAKKAVAWAEAQRRGQFAYGDLAIIAGVQDRWIGFWARECEDQGLIRCISPAGGARIRKRFEVIPTGEAPVPMVGDATEQMWTVMRKNVHGFSPLDLTAQISVPVELEEARSYCQTLLTAGYLRCVSKAVPKRKEAVYRLVTVTGIKAPRPKRLRCLVDQNTGKIIPMVEARYG